MRASKNTGKRKRTQKTNLVFDEQKRREFLTGFHKRKLQRKKKAKEEFDRLLKEERKRVKTEAKERFKKLIVSHRPIPELENLITEEYDDDETTVKIVELSADTIAKQNNWIGSNNVNFSEDVSDGEQVEDEEDQVNEVPGMELKPKKIKPIKTEITNKTSFNSEKDIKKEMKKISTKTVKKSKIFQMKNRLERQKQKKKSLKKKKMKEKFREGKQKFRKK